MCPPHLSRKAVDDMAWFRQPYKHFNFIPFLQHGYFFVILWMLNIRLKDHIPTDMCFKQTEKSSCNCYARKPKDNAVVEWCEGGGESSKCHSSCHLVEFARTKKSIGLQGYMRRGKKKPFTRRKAEKRGDSRIGVERLRAARGDAEEEAR